MKTLTAANNTATISIGKSQATDELHKAGASVIGVISCLFGCWAIACLVAGIAVSGGPLGLVTNYIKAIIG